MSQRFLGYLADVKRASPDIWKNIEQFYFSRGTDGLPDWPDWCFVPMAGFWGAISNVPDGNEMQMVESLPGIAALGKWRYTMGVYEFDPDVYEELISSPFTGKVPVDVLLRLPQWCMYIKTPSIDDTEGFFVHLEYDVNHARKELRVVLDHGDDDGGMKATNLILHLESDDLDECLSSVSDFSQRLLQDEGVDIDLGEYGSMGDFMSGAVANATGPIWRTILPLILYFCVTPDEDREPSKSVYYKNPSPKKTKRGIRLFPADGPKHHIAGKEDGEAVRQFRKMVKQGGQSGRTVKAHIRRAHWHGYWKGPRDSDEREYVYKWLPPTVVSSR